MKYICRQCKQTVSDVHICGMDGKGHPVVVQYVNRYPANRGREFMKTFGSRSEAKKLAIFQNEVEKGWIV